MISFLLSFLYLHKYPRKFRKMWPRGNVYDYDIHCKWMLRWHLQTEQINFLNSKSYLDNGSAGSLKKKLQWDRDHKQNGWFALSSFYVIFRTNELASHHMCWCKYHMAHNNIGRLSVNGTIRINSNKSSIIY